MTIKELRGFIYENYNSQIRFIKENSCYLIKYEEKEITFICDQIN